MPANRQAAKAARVVVVMVVLLVCSPADMPEPSRKAGEPVKAPADNPSARRGKASR